MISTRKEACLPFVVLLSGTHVTGKETLAPSLARNLGCPWIKGEMAHAGASNGAYSQSKKGYNFNDVFGRIWSTKLARFGFTARLPTTTKILPEHELELAKDARPQAPCLAVISLYAMRRYERDAVRAAMASESINVIITILHITKETLSGRTLGAEEPALAAHIMQGKIKDIEEPEADETDVILVDSMLDVDSLLSVIEKRIEQYRVDVGP